MPLMPLMPQAPPSFRESTLVPPPVSSSRLRIFATFALGAIASVSLLACSSSPSRPGPLGQSGPPDPPIPPQPLSAFCKDDPCLPYAKEVEGLKSKCAFAYAGSCDAYFTITYPTYPVELTRYYSPDGNLMGVKRHIAEYSKDGGVFGTLPACRSTAEKVCSGGQ